MLHQFRVRELEEDFDNEGVPLEDLSLLDKM